jgi:hypothetical protein
VGLQKIQIRLKKKKLCIIHTTRQLGLFIVPAAGPIPVGFM